jgi:hypothetical protein
MPVFVEKINKTEIFSYLHKFEASLVSCSLFSLFQEKSLCSDSEKFIVQEKLKIARW